jgi:iron complex transport system permease protein
VSRTEIPHFRPRVRVGGGAPDPVAGRQPVRVGPVSTVWRPRAVLVPVVLAVVALLLAAVDVGRGDYPIGVVDVLRILAGGGEHADRFIVVELRLPRALTALLVGLAFGLSGAILQSVARNPLASPDILGITQGAGVGAVALIVLGGGALGGITGLVGPPVAALAGGLLAATAIYLLAWRQGVSGFRLVLVGIAVSAVLSSLISYLLVVADITEATQATVWLTGSLNGRGWEHVVPVGLVVAAVGVLGVAGTATLAALRLGDDSARALGVRLQTGQAGLLGIAVLLASVAVAAAGPIPFVALVAPQVALRLVRSAGPPLLAAGLTGAVLVVASDVVSRTVLPVELPVGVLTAAIGAPYLLYLLARRTRRLDA